MAASPKVRASTNDSAPVSPRRASKTKAESIGTDGHRLQHVAVSRCRLLERNPQYLTPRQLSSLTASIERDGFTVPILVRPRGEFFEIVSGNHRFMAARSLGHKTVPAIVADLSDKAVKRLAINLNLIHGMPRAEQLAPFLSDCDDDVLSEIHLEGELLEDVKRFDGELASALSRLEAVADTDHDSPKTNIKTCRCPTCGKTHHASTSTSETSATIGERNDC